MTRLLIAVVLLATAFSATAQTDPEVLVDRYIEAVGGKAAWKAVTSFKIEMTRTSQRGNGTSVHYMLKPFCYQMASKSANGERILSYNGTTGWIKTNGEVKPMPADMQIEMREEPDFYDELIFWKERGYRLDFVTDTTIGDTAYAKVALTKSEKDVHWYYLNRNTHLIDIVEEYSEEARVAGVLFRTTFTGYTKVGDVRFPSGMQLFGDEKLLLTVVHTNIVLNAPLTTGDFLVE